MPGVYHTKQKDNILTLLKENKDAPLSAKELYVLCRKSGRPVGLATVYRQLEGLVEEQKAMKLSADGGGVRFQYLGVMAHAEDFFLKCDSCGKVHRADCELLEEVAAHMDHAHGFKMNVAKSILYGRCEGCRQHE